MISDFREGGRFSKIGESLCKKAFSIGGKSEIGGRGVKNDPKKLDIIYGRPLTTCIVTFFVVYETSLDALQDILVKMCPFFKKTINGFFIFFLGTSF